MRVSAFSLKIRNFETLVIKNPDSPICGCGRWHRGKARCFSLYYVDSNPICVRFFGNSVSRNLRRTAILLNEKQGQLKQFYSQLVPFNIFSGLVTFINQQSSPTIILNNQPTVKTWDRLSQSPFNVMQMNAFFSRVHATV